MAIQIYNFFCNKRTIITKETSELLARKNLIIFKVKCLFDRELVIFLESYLDRNTLEKEIKNYYQQKRDGLKCDNNFLKELKAKTEKYPDSYSEETYQKSIKGYEKFIDENIEKKLKEEEFARHLIEGRFSLKYWSPSTEFNNKFEKYLKLK